MFRSVSLVFAALVISTVAFAQNAPHTDQDEQACHHDARRFCKDDLPDQFKVASCLQANREKLTRACKAVLASHGI